MPLLAVCLFFPWQENTVLVATSRNSWTRETVYSWVPPGFSSCWSIYLSIGRNCCFWSRTSQWPGQLIICFLHLNATPNEWCVVHTGADLYESLPLQCSMLTPNESAGADLYESAVATSVQFCEQCPAHWAREPQAHSEHIAGVRFRTAKSAH